MPFVRLGRRPQARVLITLASALSALVLLAACGNTSIPPPGTPVLTLAASNTRFAGYIVGIDSITFSGANGVFATPLVTPETVDLARVAELGELVAAPAVPSGTYTSATVTLDYTAAVIYFQASDGTAVVATPEAPDGTVMSTAVITITFDPANPLVITNGQSSRVAINLDLDAFNALTYTSTGWVVTVQPFLTMNGQPADATPMRVRGLFVYTQASGFVMNIRPFNDLISALGGITVNTTAQTYYNIDGFTYLGAAGIAVLKGLPENVTLAAFGTLDDLATIGITPSFNASIVIGGTSLESPLEDHMLGVVTARQGDTLTLTGADFLTALGATSYLAKAAVDVGAATVVSEDGINSPALTTQAIAVGQRIDVGGVSSYAANGFVTLDATGGQVRLTNDTLAWGVLSASTPNSVTLDLLSLAGFAPPGFNFTGNATGGGAVNPAAYPVNTGAIDMSATAPGTLLAVTGLVAPFGSAPPALDASSITLGSATEQVLVVEWNAGATDPFSSISANGIVVDLGHTNLSPVHSISTGPQAIDLYSLPASPLITTTGASSPLVLGVGSEALTAGVSVYNDASKFAAALTATFNGTNQIYRLVAIGKYNSASNTFVASRINVALQETT
ncbi:MAG: hypothetical protein WCB10_14030 [Steroidobacteraceae bacterium]